MGMLTAIILRGTAAALTSQNPMLAPGQEGFELDTDKRKMNKGTSPAAWNTLSYEVGPGGSGITAGDASTNTSTSVDGEAAVFSGTGGKTLKRATGSGIAKLASGVLGTATAGTDYVGPTSGSAVQKANGSGGLTGATPGTDFYNPGGTDVAIADGGTGASTLPSGLLKGAGTSPITAATAGTDYLAPTGSGTGLTGVALTANNLSDLASATTARTNLGLGTAATHPFGDFAQVANNLGDLADAPTARFNLKVGIGARVLAVATSNITLSGLQTIDGVSLVANNTVLLTAQSAGSQNGIWQVQSGSWTRPTGFPTAGIFQTYIVPVATGGTSYGNSLWNMTNTGNVTVDTTASTWAIVNSSAVQTLTNKTLTSPVINTPTGIVKGDVGLGNVDNTSDATKNSATATISNKRKTPRVFSTTSTATLTPEIDTYDAFTLTAQAVNLTIANHSTSTPADFEQMRIRVLDSGTARTITFGTNYVARAGVALPTTTVISKLLQMAFEWNASISKWVLLASGQES